MSKIIKKHKAVITTLILAGILLLAACGTSEFDFLDYPAPDNTPGKVTQPTVSESITVDGILDEEIWQNKPEASKITFSHDKSDGEGEVESSLHLGEEGVYLYAVVEAEGVYYSPERTVTNNSSVELHLAPIGATEGASRSIISVRIAPTGDSLNPQVEVFFLWGEYVKRLETTISAAAVIDGEVNSSQAKGYTVECFVPYAELELEAKPDNVFFMPAFYYKAGPTHRSFASYQNRSISKTSMWLAVNSNDVTEASTVLDNNLTTDSFITMDGKLDEVIWSESVSAGFKSTTGANGFDEANYEYRMYTQSYLSDKGVYLGFYVKDKYIYYSGDRALNRNSYIEVFVAPKGSQSVTEDCISIRVAATGANARYRGKIYDDQDNFPWAEQYVPMKIAAHIDGTLNTSNNEGYSVEVFIPWESLNVTDNAQKNEVLVFPMVGHAENTTHKESSAPFKWSRGAALPNGQHNPSTAYLPMGENGYKFDFDINDLSDVYFTDADKEEGEFNVKLQYAKVITQFSAANRITEYLSVSGVSGADNKAVLFGPWEDGSYSLVIDEGDIDYFSAERSLTAQIEGKPAAFKVKYYTAAEILSAPVFVDFSNGLTNKGANNTVSLNEVRDIYQPYGLGALQAGNTIIDRNFMDFEGLSLGTDSFMVSFNYMIPALTIRDGNLTSGAVLAATTNPDSGTGFSIVAKNDSYRVKVGNNSAAFIKHDVYGNRDRFVNLTAMFVRGGGSVTVKLYADFEYIGEAVFAMNAAESMDGADKKLSIGGNGNRDRADGGTWDAYHSLQIGLTFDDVSVWNNPADMWGAFTAAKAYNIAKSKSNILDNAEVLLNFDDPANRAKNDISGKADAVLINNTFVTAERGTGAGVLLNSKKAANQYIETSFLPGTGSFAFSAMVKFPQKEIYNGGGYILFSTTNHDAADGISIGVKGGANSAEQGYLRIRINGTTEQHVNKYRYNGLKLGYDWHNLTIVVDRDSYPGQCLISVFQDFSYISGYKFALASNVNLNGTSGKFTLGTSQTATINENNPLAMDKVLLTNDIGFSLEDLRERYKDDIGKISDERVDGTALLNLPLSTDLSNNGTGTGTTLAGTKYDTDTSAEIPADLEYVDDAVKLNGRGNYLKADDSFKLGKDSFTVSFKIKLSAEIERNKQLVLFSTTNHDNKMTNEELIGGLSVSLQAEDKADYGYRLRYQLNNQTYSGDLRNRTIIDTDWHTLTFSFMRNNGRLVIMSYIDFTPVDVINIALPDSITLDSQQADGVSNFRIGSHFVTTACPLTWGSTVDFYVKDFIFSRESNPFYASNTLKNYYRTQSFAQDYFFIGDSYTTLSFWKTYKADFNDTGADNDLKYNIGVGGTKVEYWRDRLFEVKTLLDGNSVRYMPKNIIVHIGVNDINGGESGEDTLTAVRAMIEEYQAAFPYSNIYFITIEPNSRANAQTHAEYNIVNNGVAADAATNQRLFVIDTTELSGAQYYRDGLHLNDDGYQIWVAKIKDALGINAQ